MDERGIFPKGYVIIKNKKTGEVLVNNHNNITSIGRKIIMDKFLNNTGDGTLKDFYPYAIIFDSEVSDNNNFTYKDEYYKENNVFHYFASLNSSEIMSKDEAKKSIKFNITITYDSTSTKTTLSGLSILMKHASQEQYQVFSRIKFDTIVLDPSIEFAIEYYLYF